MKKIIYSDHYGIEYLFQDSGTYWRFKGEQEWKTLEQIVLKV